MNMGERIKELRDEAELTHVELARAVGCSVGLISLWENNLRTPSADSLISLAKVFSVSTDYLLGLDE